MWVFHVPPLHSYFLFPHVLLHSHLPLLFIFSPPFGFMAKSHHMEEQMEGSEHTAVCLLFDKEHKNGLKTPQADVDVSSTGVLSVLPQLLAEHVCHSGHWEGGGAPSPLEQLIKLKFINFNSADPKFALESVFRSGRLTRPHITPDVQTQVWRQESCISSWAFAKPSLLVAEAGVETVGSFPQPPLNPSGVCLSFPLPRQRQPWLTTSAIEETTTLRSPLLIFESSIESEPHNKVFIPGCNTSLLFTSACCTYRTEVSGGLIT